MTTSMGRSDMISRASFPSAARKGIVPRRVSRLMATSCRQWESSSRTRVSRQRGRASEIRVNMFELLLPKHAGIAGTYRPDRAIRLTGSDDSDIFVVRYCDGVFPVVFLNTSLKTDLDRNPLSM